MIIFSALIALVHQVGLSLAIGSSTYAVTFYFKSIQDGVMNDTEKDFLHTVYFILRVGMALIIVSEIGNLIVTTLSTSFLAYVSLVSVQFKWFLLATIGTNAFLMHLHKMPMGFGPAIAGGTWYMYLIADTLGYVALPIYIWIALHALFVFGFWLLLKAVRYYMMPAVPATPSGAPKTN